MLNYKEHPTISTSLHHRLRPICFANSTTTLFDEENGHPNPSNTLAMILVQRVNRFFRRRHQRTSPKPPVVEPEPYAFVPDDYPIFPPPSPELLLSDVVEYWNKVQSRKFAAPCGASEDTPLYALYRLYEAFVLDKRFAYRNMLETFWRKSAWKISAIPDPTDSDPSRYAFLAGVTYLMVKSFNQRIAIGLTRGARPLMSAEDMEAAKEVPHDQRPYESVPEWAAKVPQLEQALSIPTESGEFLSGKDDRRADPDFLKKNIVIWTPHIYFT